jgi:hypothetical protein
LARLQPRQIEQFVNEASHPPRLIVDRLRRALLFVGRIGRAIQQRLAPAGDRREWCLQVVGDVGHEVTLRLLGGLHLGSHAVEAAGQTLNLVRPLLCGTRWS